MKLNSYVSVFIDKINGIHNLIKEKSNREILGFFNIPGYNPDQNRAGIPGNQLSSGDSSNLQTIFGFRALYSRMVEEWKDQLTMD